MHDVSDSSVVDRGAQRRALASVMLAALMVLHAAWTAFHLASERHLAPGERCDCRQGTPFTAGATAAQPQCVGESDADHPHHPHSVLDHKVAQDHRTEALSLLPMLVAIAPPRHDWQVPRDRVGTVLIPPPTGPPRTAGARSAARTRAPPRA